MKVGDLVRCTFQPKYHMDADLGYQVPLEHQLKGRIGIVSTVRSAYHCLIYFPEINYTHCLSHDAFEVVAKTGTK